MRAYLYLPLMLALLSAGAPTFAADEVPTLDAGANGFVLLSAMLVIVMSIPAIGLFYGGLVRAKNVMSVLEQCLIVFALCIILWFVCGYSLSFSSDDGVLSSFIGNFDLAFLLGAGPDALNGSLSLYTWFIFQGAFCAIAACLIVGASVERVRFGPLLAIICLWALFSYVPLCHMVWGGGFIDSVFHAYDFAGGTVVHIDAAVAALVLAKCVGKRTDLGKVLITPHSLPITYIGMGFLWIGWFGFNAGSQLASDGISAMAFVDTAIAPAAAAVSWMAAEWLIYKKPTTLGSASGVLAGLVAITPACGFVSPLGALIIGLIAGPACLYGVHGLKRLIGLDDSLDVFGVHGVGAIVGALLTGVFCAPSLGGVGFKADITSIGGQVYAQAASVVIAIVWAGVVTFLACMIVKALCGGSLRVALDAEREGLDLSTHGERGYSL